MNEPLPAVPFPESYWVIPGRFLAGNHPSIWEDETITSARLNSLLKTGLDTFIDLTEDNERPPYFPLLSRMAAAEGREVVHVSSSIQDVTVPSAAQMTTILDAIDLALSGGHKVYLHCVGGIGRTGTVVGCWLVRHGMKPLEALQQLQILYGQTAQKRLYPHSPESEEQAQFILNWNEH